MSEWNVSEQTATKWRERVDQWRASGESATSFASTRGFASSTLRYWSYRLGRGDKQTKKQRFVRLVPKSIPTARASEILVEVGNVRVRVARGFDAALLGDVMRALGAAR